MQPRGKVLSIGGEPPMSLDSKSKRKEKKGAGKKGSKEAVSKKEKKVKGRRRTVRGIGGKKSAERIERTDEAPQQKSAQGIPRPKAIRDPDVKLKPKSPKEADFTKIPNGAIIETEKQRYRVIHKLGAGGCGETFVVENLKSKRRLCAKVEFLKDDEQRLRREFDIYREIGKIKKGNKNALPHLLQCSDFGEVQDKIHFMFLPLCHNSLSGLVSSDKGFPSIATAFEISIQVLEGIRELHSMGFIHRDLKPANVCVNSAMTTAYIIDFGMSCKFITDASKMPKTSVYNFIGTRTYAPRDAHKGLPQSRKSDLESWLYLILELFIPDILPWYNQLSDKKTLYMKDLFFSSCYHRRIAQAPMCFNDSIAVIEAASIVDAPDYEKIIAMIRKDADNRKVGLKQKFKFDSTPLDMDISLWKTGIEAIERSKFSSIEDIKDDKLPIPFINEPKIKSNNDKKKEAIKKLASTQDADPETNSCKDDDETLRSSMKCRVVPPPPGTTSNNGNDDDSDKSVKPSEKQTR